MLGNLRGGGGWERRRLGGSQAGCLGGDLSHPFHIEKHFSLRGGEKRCLFVPYSVCSNRSSCVCITIWVYVNTVLPQIAILLCLIMSFRTIMLEETGFNGILPIPFPPLLLALIITAI